MKIDELKKGDTLHVRNFINDDELFKITQEYYPSSSKEKFLTDNWCENIKLMFGKTVVVRNIKKIEFEMYKKLPTISVDEINYFLLPSFFREFHSQQLFLFEEDL
jgi:hypothetical protein